MVGVNYLKNHLGFKLTEQEMGDIPNPRAELVTHVTIKDVQAFGLLGSLLFGPLAAVARKPTRSAAGVASTAARLGTRGALLGLIAGPAMALGRMRTLNDEEVRWRGLEREV